ncbi:MAG: cytochrome c oxidase accessory protein CcoG [Pseudomonadota bacterium]
MTTAEAVKTAATLSDDGPSTHDVEAVNSAARRQLYKAREPIYPKLVFGKFRTLKWALLIFTLGVYYGLPWMRWPRGLGEPDQAVLVDFPGRRFYFFFIEIWPDELYYVTGLLILASFGLFFVTALFGRVWCGYACPQTVWTDLYIAAERLVEGDRNKRMRLDKAPWSVKKATKKATKHALWLLIAAATGGAWVFYFHDAPTVLPQIFQGTAPLSAYMFIGILTFTTYMFAGSMREQVCTYMCPWPRIQAALTDADTLEVTYRRDRGEPRGAHKKGVSWEGRGDCIDCKACVVACPMGIDIRDGAQLECINCALCIDACDEIMVKVGRPVGLIAYDTDKNVAARAAGATSSVSLVRPRTTVYAGALALVGVLMLWSLMTRASVEMNVLKDRTPPFVQLSDGGVRNAYTVKLVNKANEARDFVISVSGLDGVSLSAVGAEASDGTLTVEAAGDAVRSVRLFLTLPADPSGRAAPSTAIMFTARDAETGEVAVSKSVFLRRRS